ncbi:unnamed protein product [Didymodactylos carnosus]|uniref:Cytochrome P450 n=1 Tax=Didymodactylos carnosus TaxID=1234261 RepID=A0A814AUT7_9BILA|nr:unnamed protein product [Didymodactylos carnosus]CAF1033123.1 unnamed protein product [Didymodactylos carnosus]CAF3699920.1 unnamed protein product [Didymodactylos carnosus]CAF3801387.1 unnamed protein product [Didymodactylos carnosus]
MVINETLRMYPPILRFDRVTAAPYELDGYHLPSGMARTVGHECVSAKCIAFFERFSLSEKARHHPLQFLPFGDGPRNCIGMRFALQEVKIAIVNALRTVAIERCEKTEVPVKLTKSPSLGPQNGIWIRVAKR